jgi:cellulose 1,4-beta-cellobiosidase
MPRDDRQPAAPVLRQAIAGDGSVTLTWLASAGATSFSVWRRSGGSAYTVVATSITGTTYNDIGLVNGTTYEYVVAAHNIFGRVLGHRR